MHRHNCRQVRSIRNHSNIGTVRIVLSILFQSLQLRKWYSTKDYAHRLMKTASGSSRLPITPTNVLVQLFFIYQYCQADLTYVFDVSSALMWYCC